MSKITLGRLRWILILLPTFLIGAFEFIRHQYFHSANDFWANLVGMGLVAGGAYILAHFVFRAIAALQQDILQRNLELSALNNIVQAASRSLNVEEVLKIVTGKVLEVIPAAGGGVYLSQDGKLSLSYSVGLPLGLLSSIINLNDASLKGCDATCRDAGREGIVTANQGEKSGYWSYFPIEGKGGVLGVFCLLRDKPLGEWEIDFLSLVSREIAFLVEHAHLYSQVQELAILEERDRIAKEIHDGLAQILGYVSFKSAVAQQMLAANKIAETSAELNELGKVAQEAYADAREAILGLKTSISIDGGLARSLNEYITRLKRGSSLSIELDMEKGQQFKLLPATEVQLIRIIQEALTNVRKHAQASKAVVRFRSGEGIARISVEDNGQGFNGTVIGQREGQHFGLQSMKERAERVGGSFRVESTPGVGTKVEVVLPLKVEEG